MWNSRYGQVSQYPSTVSGLLISESSWLCFKISCEEAEFHFMLLTWQDQNYDDN